MSTMQVVLHQFSDIFGFMDSYSVSTVLGKLVLSSGAATGRSFVLILASFINS